MVLAKVAQGETVQVPLVSRIAEGTEVGVMGRDDEHATAGLKQPVELFHRSNDIRHVFDDVNSTDLAKGGVLKRKRKVVEIGDYVGISITVAINPNCAGIFLDSTAYVKHPARHPIRRRRIVRQST